ncbi:C40 family peptidase [Maridesulfovibrio sp. FT414]|uniref:C40 family peptidase n=1 Tax=Maridesulfovibrio sp. FT414 TaxID=2979469 RepID=UPI003D803342
MFVLLILPLAGGCGKSPVALHYTGYNEQLPASGSRIAHAVVQSARAQIGKPYKWGGASPSEGFDCSGLVWWAYHRHGVKLPRVSWQQAEAGRPVHLSRISAGDIVFFRIPGQDKSLHTGIYSGEGSFFIHSPKSGHVVREESMDKAYWRKYYIGARRVL